MSTNAARYPDRAWGSMLASPGEIALQVGPFSLRWYGILVATAVVIGLWYAYRQALSEGLPAADINCVFQLSILSGLIGARAYDVAFEWDHYRNNLLKVVAVWQGGLSIQGGVIVGVLAAIPLGFWWRVPVLRSLDISAPSIALCQAIGRWGNFFNEEAFGRPTDIPWKLYISPENRPPGYLQYNYFHPTFLYESIWDAMTFAILVSWLRPKYRSNPGALFFFYIGLYSIGRFAIESLRLDSFWVRGVRVAQFVSVIGVVLAMVGLTWTLRDTRSDVTRGTAGSH